MAKKPRLSTGGITADVGGHDVTLNPLTGQASAQIGSLPLPLNPSAGLGPSGIPSIPGTSGTSVNPLSSSVGTSVNTGSAGDVHTSVGAGIDSGGNLSVSPTAQVGNSPGAHTGAQLGGAGGSAAGTALAGPVGGAAGSLIGSAIGSIAGNTFAGNKDHQQRNNVRGSVTSGFGGSEFLLPDGTTANLSLDAHDGQHDFKFQDRRVDNQGDRKLNAYDVDYTNDLDYIAGMGGTSLSRLINGKKSKSVDQIGGLLGNQSLGSVGFGKEMNPQNFKTVTGNLRAMYAKQGIQNKEEFLALSNQAFADGRINDTDHAVMQQTANIVFDGDYNTASQLMAGRNQGIKTAAAAAPQGSATQAKMYSPFISPNEAIMSVQPYIDAYKAARKEGYDYKIDKGLQGRASIAQGVALATGLYSIGNKLTDGALTGAIKAGASAIGSGASWLYNDITGSPHNEGLFGGIDDIFNTDLSGVTAPLGGGSGISDGVGGIDLGSLDLGV